MWTHAELSATTFHPPCGFVGQTPSKLPGNPLVFNTAWDALRLPGMRHKVEVASPPVPGLFPATVALCQALVTAGRNLWLDQPSRSLIHQWFCHKSDVCLVSSPEQADFTLVTSPARMPSLYELNIGDGADPATATTLLIQLTDLDALERSLWQAAVARHSGLDPHVDTTECALLDESPDLTPTFWHQREELQEMLPWGIDIFFIHDGSFVALPRDMAFPSALAA